MKAGYKKHLPDLTLYVIVGTGSNREKSLLNIAEEAIEGGAGVIQLREKEMKARALVEAGLELRALTAEKGVAFIVNDRVDVARAVDADGVHLGQEDLPPAYAREILGPDKIIGISASNIEEAAAAEREGADYIGLGAVFATQTKGDAGLPVGVETVREVTRRVNVPVVAIGGINFDNVGQVIKAGADGIAVVSAVTGVFDVRSAARRLLSRIKEAKRV